MTIFIDWYALYASRYKVGLKYLGNHFSVIMKTMPDTFTYQAFRVDSDKRTVFFDYQLTHQNQAYQLTETLIFPVALRDNGSQNAALRALHLALGISYYKTFLPPAIEHPYKMDAAEADFWNEVWRGGLGEFLYVNHLSPDQLAHFSVQDGIIFDFSSPAATQSQAALLGIGGGKDSIVAGESLKAIGLKVEGFVMATGEQLGQTKAVADTMSVPLFVVERTLDKQLLELQERPGGYKGHVPISLIFGLVGTALAIANGDSYVIVANEASASIPRHDSEYGAVNHQWSKSFTFEQRFQLFAHEHITRSVTYFSAIRELTSVAVAKLFAQYPQYFEVFTSDNFVFRVDPTKRPNARWSLESPKSLSSFILLAPWLHENDMLRTFGRDFLNEPSLEPLLLSLTGQQGEPPLDCVGTVDELVLSLNLAAQQNKFSNSHLMKVANERGIIHDNDWQTAQAAMLQLQTENALPEDLRHAIEGRLREGLAA